MIYDFSVILKKNLISNVQWMIIIKIINFYSESILDFLNEIILPFFFLYIIKDIKNFKNIILYIFIVYNIFINEIVDY